MTFNSVFRSILSLLIFTCCYCMKNVNIQIRGSSNQQQLPKTMARTWTTWTLNKEMNDAEKVEDASDELGFVDSTSFEELYLPSDLPIPSAKAALGIVIANGIPRYILPSIILTLNTPDKEWRNRGLCSVVRADGWLDIFSPFVPSLDKLKFSCFAQYAPDVRFLEDQDGTGSWTNAIDSESSINNDNDNLSPSPSSSLIKEAYESVDDWLKTCCDVNHPIMSGYHFIDIPLTNDYDNNIKIPPLKLKAFISDVDAPERLIEVEPNDLDVLPAGSLDIQITEVAAGGKSEFLPACYQALYEEGNIISL